MIFLLSFFNFHRLSPTHTASSHHGIRSDLLHPGIRGGAAPASSGHKPEQRYTKAHITAPVTLTQAEFSACDLWVFVCLQVRNPCRLNQTCWLAAHGAVLAVCCLVSCCFFFFVLFLRFFLVYLCDCEWAAGWLQLTQHGCSAALMREKAEGRRRFVMCHQSEQLMIPDWKIQLFIDIASVKVASIGGHITVLVLL